MSVPDLRVETCLLYIRFGIFTTYKGMDAELPAQASPSTLVKPRIFRSYTNLYYTHHSLVPMIV